MKFSDIKKNIKYDLSSGLVVFLVALPLCLGVALASTGRPDLLFSGIIAGVIGGIIVGFLSGSYVGVSGPAAGLVVIVLTAIDTIGSWEGFLLALVFAGIIQLVAGFLKAGVIGYYIPTSVIKGMLAAIGLILIMKELPHAFGFDATVFNALSESSQTAQSIISKIFNFLLASSWGAIIITIISLGILILFERPFMKKFGLFKVLPGALFVVFFGIALNQFFVVFFPEFALLGKNLVQLPVANSPTEFVSFFKTPDFSQITNPTVYTVAITIAIVASLETLLSVEATDKLDPLKRVTPTNRELKAQGIGNIVSGLIGGLPITQVIVRSSVNISSGGKTKMAAIIHGIFLLLSVAFIPFLLNYIPLASLASILLLTGYKLSKVGLYKNMYKLGWAQFIPFFVTVVAVFSTDLLEGIIIGITFSIFFTLLENYKNSYHYKEEIHQEGKVVRLTLSEEMTFLNKASLRLALNQLPENSKAILDGTKCIHIDYDVLESIFDFSTFTSKEKNIELEIVGIDISKYNFSTDSGH